MNKLPNMHDSGKRETFASGAVRDTAGGKPRPDLISPHANLREGAWLARGAEKYKERNWEAGINISRCVASLTRHLEDYKLGKTDEDNMAAIRTNAGFILHYEEEIKAGRMDPSLDDMPKYAEPLPPCPRCGDVMVPMYCAETGAECYCDGCGLTSLDAWPSKQTEARIRKEHKAVEYAPQPEPMNCPCCGTPCPQTEKWSTYRCLECGWGPFGIMPESGDQKEFGSISFEAASALSFISQMDDRYTGNDAMIAGTSDPLAATKVAMSPTFYVAGPMRGHKDLNFAAFDAARDRGKRLGYNIISPADMDREYGIDPIKDPTVAEHENDLSSAELREIVQRDIEVITSLRPERGDGIAVLNGWGDSTGARAEVALAQWLGLRIIYAADFHTEVHVEVQ